jgi:hypothetical protein
MTTHTGLGYTPNAFDVMVGQLAYEQFANMQQFELAREIAPLADLGAHEGSYVAEVSGYNPVDLSQDANQLSAVSVETDSYIDMQLAFEDKTFALERFLAGKFRVTDIMADKWRRQHGVDIETKVARRLAEKAAAQHSHKVLVAATTAANYTATTNTYDPGDLTSASFDVLGSMTTLAERLADGGVDITKTVYLVGTPVEINRLLKLTQVQAWGSGSDAAPNTNLYVNDERLSATLSQMSGLTIKVRRATQRYKLANGTFGYSATAATLAWVQAAGGFESSMFKTLHSSTTMFRVESQRNAAVRGVDIYGDSYYQIHTANKAAGVLWTSIAS